LILIILLLGIVLLTILPLLETFKFVLPIFLSFSIHLSGDDKEFSLRKKLPEKTAFLILQATDWPSPVGYLQLDKAAPIPKTLVEARALVVDKLEKIYDKRSAFAHPRSKNVSDVSSTDFDFTTKVLRSVFLKLDELSKEGITHIREEGRTLQDRKSLDTYIERLKHG